MQGSKVHVAVSGLELPLRPRCIGTHVGNDFVSRSMCVWGGMEGATTSLKCLEPSDAAIILWYPSQYPAPPPTKNLCAEKGSGGKVEKHSSF